MGTYRRGIGSDFAVYRTIDDDPAAHADPVGDVVTLDEKAAEAEVVAEVIHLPANDGGSFTKRIKNATVAEIKAAIAAGEFTAEQAIEAEFGEYGKKRLMVKALGN